MWKCSGLNKSHFGNRLLLLNDFSFRFLRVLDDKAIEQQCFNFCTSTILTTSSRLFTIYCSGKVNSFLYTWPSFIIQINIHYQTPNILRQKGFVVSFLTDIQTVVNTKTKTPV